MKAALIRTQRFVTMLDMFADRQKVVVFQRGVAPPPPPAELAEAFAGPSALAYLSDLSHPTANHSGKGTAARSLDTGKQPQSHGSSEGQQIQTIHRHHVEAPRRLEHLRDLKQEKKIDTDILPRAVINREIRNLRSTFLEPFKPPPSNNNFSDLQGHSIGKTACINASDCNGDVVVGPSSLVCSASFDFVRRDMNKSNGALFLAASQQDSTALRFTAYLTELGQRSLRDFVREQLKSLHERTENRTRSVRPSSAEIKDRFLSDDRMTFDFDVEGVKVHCNLVGKVQVFCPLVDKSLAVIEQSQTPHKTYRHYILKFARFSRFKAWVMRTTDSLNQEVVDGFAALGKVINKIAASQSNSASNPSS